MLETSQDLLFVILAVCILWLTIFLSWGLWYIIQILKQSNAMVVQVHSIVNKVQKVVLAIENTVMSLKGNVDKVAGVVNTVTKFTGKKKDKSDK